MKKYIILSLFVIIPLFSFSTHKYFLSLTQINFKPKAKTVQIIINVFIDDIETALNKNYNIDLELDTNKELKNNDVYFEKYFKNKLLFNIDGVFKKYNYLGKEYDNDLVYFYLEIEDIESVATIEIQNKILIDCFPEQQNLIKTKINTIHKSVLLTNTEFKKTFHYKTK